MASAQVDFLSDPERVRVGLTPIRRDLLQRLQEPASATQLAADLGTGRQRINYHLRALEEAGLVKLVEERQRRGCVERVLVATANNFVVDPSLMRRPDAVDAQDRFAAEHLIATAGGVVRDVARMQAAADEEDKRLLTFTIETEVRFAEPSDVERFTTTVARLIGRAAAEFSPEKGGRSYRVVVGGHPAPKKDSKKASKKKTKRKGKNA
jgi:DNA-binding transcriptional ArsR family regulator